MSLDHVMLLNLKRRKDKYWCAIGALSVLGFDVQSDMVIRFITHDGLDYKDVKSVHDAAIADGFDEFAGWRADSRAWAAWFWSYRCALRKVAEMDETILLLIDDFVPRHGWTYDRFRRLVYSCECYDHGFRIVQLTHSKWGEESTDSAPHNNMLAVGLAGYADSGVLINKEGAELLLSIMKAHPGAHPEYAYAILKEQQHDPEIFQGLWHTLDEILHLLPTNAKSDLQSIP